MAESSGDELVIRYVPDFSAVDAALDQREQRAQRAVTFGGNGQPGTPSIQQQSTLPPAATPATRAHPTTQLPATWQAQINQQMGTAAQQLPPGAVGLSPQGYPINSQGFVVGNPGQTSRDRALIAQRESEANDRLREQRMAEAERARVDAIRGTGERARGIADDLAANDRLAANAQRERADAIRLAAEGYRREYHDTIQGLAQAGRRDLQRFNARVAEFGPNQQVAEIQQRMRGLDPLDPEFQDLRRRAAGMRGRTGLNTEVATTGMFMAALFSGWEVAGAGMALRGQERFAAANPQDLIGQMRVNQEALQRIQSGPIGAQIGMLSELMGDAVENARGSAVGRFLHGIMRNIPGMPGLIARQGERVLATRSAVDEANAIIASNAIIEAQQTTQRGFLSQTRIGRAALSSMDPAAAQYAKAQEELAEVTRQAARDTRTAFGRNVPAGQRQLELQQITDTVVAAQGMRDTQYALIDRAVRIRVRENLIGDRAAGDIGMLEAGGLGYAARERAIRVEGAAATRNAPTMREQASAMERMARGLEALTTGNNRMVDIGLAQMGAQTLASFRGRIGDSLGAATARINAQFLPQFTDGDITGFANLDPSNPRFKEMFETQREAYREAIAGARQEEYQRNILRRGQNDATRLLLRRNPLGASIMSRMSAFDAAALNVTPQRYDELREEMILGVLQDAQQRADQRQDIGLNLMGRRGAITALENRNPLGASVAQLVAQAQSEEVALRRQGFGTEANQVQELAKRQLDLMERDYREGFTGSQLESKLLLPGIFDKFTNESPQDVFRSFREGRGALGQTIEPVTAGEAVKTELSGETISALAKGIAQEISALIAR